MNTRIFHKISYGLYVIGSTKEEALNGQIANTVFQVSSNPAMIAVSINKNNLTNEFIKASKVFSVSVLSKDVPLSLIGHFGFKSGRDINKFQTVSYTKGITGVPIIKEHTLGYLEAEIIADIDVKTHTLFVGRVIESELYKDGEPMTYAYYHLVKGGKEPPAAPTFIMEKTHENNMKGDKIIMKKYKCMVCGYIYNPENGDDESGIAPGTVFEDLPEDWVCPVCGVAKDQFEAME